jgi:acyl-CoA thioesterase-2
MDATEFLGLRSTHNPHRWFLPLSTGVCTRGGFLFGGCGLAAAVTALEATTGRDLIWATAQYLDYGRPPAVLDLDVIVPVSGKRVTQARAVGHVLDREIITVNAALGSRPLDVEGQWAEFPDVPAPEDCPPPDREQGQGTIDSRVDLRVAHGSWGTRKDRLPSGDGRSALWVRIPEMDLSAAALAIMADWMTGGVGPALARWAGANSLDNTIRILRVVPTQWVLCDIRIHGVRRGFAHGLIHLWSREGELLATGGQSAIVRIFD